MLLTMKRSTELHEEYAAHADLKEYINGSEMELNECDELKGVSEVLVILNVYVFHVRNRVLLQVLKTSGVVLHSSKFSSSVWYYHVVMIQRMRGQKKLPPSRRTCYCERN